MSGQFSETNKFYKVPAKRRKTPGKFGIFIDPTKCKGCAECVEACDDLGYHALKMIEKERHDRSHLPEEHRFLPQAAADAAGVHQRARCRRHDAGGAEHAVRRRGRFLRPVAEKPLQSACGWPHWATSTDRRISASPQARLQHGIRQHVSLQPVHRALEQTRYLRTAPPLQWVCACGGDQLGWEDKQLWVMGGDGAMLDNRLSGAQPDAGSGMNIKVLVLDTQVYSNTGGQTSTASFMGQDSKMYSHGKVLGRQAGDAQRVGPHRHDAPEYVCLADRSVRT